jgi:cyclophilin family peptidyl-prolyl cis-trans isomerase
LESACEAVLHTSEGDLRVAFAPDAAPATVDNFLRLARVGFYDGTIFHRIVPLDREGRPFVVQGGDPTGTGDGGPGWNLALEPSDMPHARGVLGMARGDDPHSAGSQFYIGLSRDGTARLDGQYCTFAFMLDGMDTLDRLARSPIGDSATGRPSKPPTLDRVEIVPSRACETGRPPHGGEPTPPTPVTPAEPATAVTP